MAVLFFTYNHSNLIRQMKWLFFRRNFKNSNKIAKTAPLDVTIRVLSDHALVHCKATDVLLTIYFYHPRRKYGWSKK